MRSSFKSARSLDSSAGAFESERRGHFALEDKAAEIAALMRDFLARTPAALAA